MAEIAYYSSEWIGAVLIYLIKRRRIKFDIVYSKTNRRTNVLIGYSFKLIVVVAMVILAIISTF